MDYLIHTGMPEKTPPSTGLLYLYRTALLVLAISASTLPGCAITNVIPTSGNSTDAGLDGWVSNELTPYLVDQLGRQPRFRDEPVLLIAMRDADIRPEIDLLTQSVRAQLLDQLLLAPGTDLAWRPNSPPLEHHRSPDKLKCSMASTARYFVGIDIYSSTGDTVRVRVRALDITAGSWVSGFGMNWQGQLTQDQQQAWKEHRTDEYLRGLRVLPFQSGESDLLAEYVARNISCILRDQQALDAQITLEPGVTDQPELKKLLTLVSHNLAQHRKPHASQGAGNESVVLAGSLTHIDRDLHQLWVKLRVKSGDQPLAKVDTSAYILSDQSVSSQVAQSTDVDTQVTNEDTVTANNRHNPLLSPLRVLRGSYEDHCDGWNYTELPANELIYPDECIEVEYDLFESAHVLVVRHTANGALGWLPADGCLSPYDSDIWQEAQPAMRIRDLHHTGDRRTRQKGVENIYAMAVTDAHLANKIVRHMSQLPSGCEPDLRTDRGSDFALEWLAALDALINRSTGNVTWQEVSIRHEVY